MSFCTAGSEKTLKIHEQPAYESFGGENGVLGVGDGLSLGGGAHQFLPVCGEGHDRGGGAETLLIFDHFGHVAFHNCDAGVGRTEVDSDYVGGGGEARRGAGETT